MKKFIQLFLTFLLPVVNWGQTTYTSTATGNWSTQTWSPAGTPGASDNVIIANGHNVTINQDVSVASITVGQGTSGVLTFDGVAIRAVTVSGDVTVASGGSFITQASGTFTNTMSIGGNLTNNGIFDMSRGTTTTICNVTFNKAGDQTISGSPTLTRFRIITLNKSALGNRVMCSSNVSAAGAIGFTTGTWEQTANTLTITSTNQAIGANSALIFSGSGNLNMAIAASIAVSGTLTVNTSGTFTMGSGNNSITTSGTPSLNFTSGAVTIRGRLTLTVGTTTINGASVAIDPQATNLISATNNVFEVSGSANLTFSSGSLTIVDPITLTGIGREISITSSGTVDFAGGTINIGDGSSTSTGADGFEIANSTSNALNNLTIQTGGIAGRNVTLINSISVTGTLTLTSGNITTGSNTLSLGSSATISGEAAGKYVVGTLATTTAVGSGSSSSFGGIGLSLSSAAEDLGNVTVARITGSHATLNSNTGINRIWSINPTNTLTAARDLTLTWNSDDDNGKALTSVQVWKSTDNFATTGNTSAVGSTTDGSSRSVTVSLTSLTASANTTFTITQSDQPLPVELTSFTRNIVGKKVKLNWQTATEVNNYKFEVERRQTGNVKSETWETLGFVQGNGNSNSPKNYSFTDEPYGGKEFKYRLKQIDFDGKFEYSDEVTAVFEDVTTFELEQNYPNPFNPFTKISYTIPQRSNVKLRVYNMLAQMEAELVNEFQEAGHYQVIFNGNNLPSGTYFYKLEAGKFVEVKKFLLVK